MLMPSFVIAGAGLVAITGLRLAVRRPALALVLGLGGGLMFAQDTEALPQPLAQVVDQVQATTGVLGELRSIAGRSSFRQGAVEDPDMAGQYYESRSVYSRDMNEFDSTLRGAFGNVAG